MYIIPPETAHRPCRELSLGEKLHAPLQTKERCISLVEILCQGGELCSPPSSALKAQLQKLVSANKSPSAGKTALRPCRELSLGGKLHAPLQTIERCISLVEIQSLGDELCSPNSLAVSAQVISIQLVSRRRVQSQYRWPQPKDLQEKSTQLLVGATAHSQPSLF